MTVARRTRTQPDIAPVPTIKRTIVTPAMAMQMLDHRAQNRHVSDTLVARYTRDMVAGRWMENAIPVLLDSDGALLDGQHRLTAVVESGLEFPFFVARGVDAAAMVTVDTGRGRSAADMLTIRGLPYANALAAAGRLALGYRLWERDPKGPGVAAMKNLTSVAEVVAYVDAHSELVESVNLVCPLTARTGTVVPVSGLCMVHHLAATNLREQVSGFAEGAATGEALEADSPILVLRNKFLRLRGHHRKQIDATYMDKVAWIVRAWNAYAEGRTLTQIVSPRRRRDRFPRIVGA